MNRPVLPTRLNHHLQLVNPNDLPPVKYQVLTCAGSDIVVGRMKINAPTSSGHAFILRRYDTGAVSLTTMFRAAYPDATDSEEKREYQWVKDRYDLSGNNGSSKEPQITRLAGTWVGTDVALALGVDYHLSSIMEVVVNSEPDPTGNYRRSGKPNGSQSGAAPSSSPVKTQIPRSSPTKAKSPAPFPSQPADNGAKSLPTPTRTSPTNPSHAKRRRESPAPEEATAPEPSPAKSTSVRRSTRTKSPAPRSSAPLPPLTSIPRPAKKKAIRKESPGVEESAQEEGQESIEDVASAELHQQDVQEQKEMIEDLKMQREAAMRAASALGEEDSGVPSKRSREEDEQQELAFEFKEPEVGERAIATNRRAQNAYQRLQPQQKSFVWGAAAFSFGLAAVTFLPNFF